MLFDFLTDSRCFKNATGCQTTIQFTRSTSSFFSSEAFSNHSRQNMNNSSFFSVNQQSGSGATMFPTEIDVLLKRMKDLEAQNSEFYKNSTQHRFDESAIAKYLNELIKLVNALLLGPIFTNLLLGPSCSRTKIPRNF